MRSIKKRFVYILPSIMVVLLIFVGTCLLKSKDIPDMPKAIPWDKLVHFGMFFLMTISVLWGYYKYMNGNIRFWESIFLAFLIPVLYGGVIELLQKYIFIFRSAEWLDFFADAAGSLIAFIIMSIYIRKERKRN